VVTAVLLYFFIKHHPESEPKANLASSSIFTRAKTAEEETRAISPDSITPKASL